MIDPEFRELEFKREDEEERALEEWLATKAPAKPCPACGMPIDDPELIVCTECFYEEW